MKRTEMEPQKAEPLSRERLLCILEVIGEQVGRYAAPDYWCGSNRGRARHYAPEHLQMRRIYAAVRDSKTRGEVRAVLRTAAQRVPCEGPVLQRIAERFDGLLSERLFQGMPYVRCADARLAGGQRG